MYTRTYRPNGRPATITKEQIAKIHELDDKNVEMHAIAKELKLPYIKVLYWALKNPRYAQIMARQR